LTGIAVLFLVNGMSFGSWLPRLPEIRDRAGLDIATIGVVLTVSGIGGLVGSATSGALVGRLGPRRAAIWPAVVLCLLLPLIGVAPGAVLLGSVIGVAAIADSVADVGMNALAVRAQMARGRSIFTRLHGLWSLGSLGGGAIATAAAALGIDLPIHLAVVAGASILALAWASTTLPPTERTPRTRPRVRLALSIGALGGAVALVEGVPHDWGTIFLTDVARVAASSAGTAFIALSGGMLVGRLAGDRVVDRIGIDRSMYGGLALVAASLVGLVTTDSQPVALAAFVLWGLGVAVVFPLLYRLAGSHRGFAEGSGLAALTLGSRVGFMAGPAAVAAVTEATSLPIGILSVVGVALIGTVVGVFTSLSDGGTVETA
jgi:predicted MFS family arabinose efflux permease